MQASQIVTIQTVSEKLAISFPTASAALWNLAKIGVVRETTGRRRGRIYAYSEYLVLIDRGTEKIRSREVEGQKASTAISTGEPLALTEPFSIIPTRARRPFMPICRIPVARPIASAEKLPQH